MYSTGGFGQPQYGQPPQQIPQQTGYGLPQLQAQYTGYPGIVPQQQQQQQPPPMPQIPAQYQGQQARFPGSTAATTKLPASSAGSATTAATSCPTSETTGHWYDLFADG